MKPTTQIQPSVILLLVVNAFANATVHDLTEEERKQTFGTAHINKGIVNNMPNYKLFYPSATMHDSGLLNKLNLHLHDTLENITLSFQPTFDSLFSTSLELVERHANGSHLNVGNDNFSNCHFIHSDDSTHAAVSNCDGHLKGVILKPEGAYVIHPVPSRLQKRYKRSSHNQYGLHVIYKRDVTSQEMRETCFIDESDTADIETVDDDNLAQGDSSTETSGVVRSKRYTKDEELTVELAIFVDEKLWYSFSDAHGAYADNRLRDYVATVVNNIRMMYQSPSISPKISFKMVRYEVFKTQPSELHGSLHSYGQAQQYLDRFCRYQAKLSQTGSWDHAFLLSGHNLHRGSSSSQISGIARLHGMCNTWNTCTLTEGLDFTSVFIGTHEIGHSLGMKHDEPFCNSQYIMSASLGPGKTTWSSCSQNSFNKFIEKLDLRSSNCLRKLSGRDALAMDTALPGQRYDADEQCAMMHGKGYSRATPTMDHPDTLCYMMWCGQSRYGRIITSHPALEGTECAPGKWCHKGKCVATTTTIDNTKYEYRKPPKPVNGGWSKWSPVTCSTCNCPGFPNSIGVVRSERQCNQPPPANNGKDCVGSSYRGILCKKCKSNKDRLDSYASRICEGHRVNKGDYELTGEGGQLRKYASRACKVFCIVKNKYLIRNYRFFNDYFPDGTHCGINRYCVAGQCLPKACGDTALVNNYENCPAKNQVCTTDAATIAPVVPVKIPSKWTFWESWSSCSASCGTGYKTRRRQCTFGTNNWPCQGLSQENMNCNEGYCPWNSWSSCSHSCDEGLQKRIRFCPGGGCAGSNREERTCSQNPCITWSEWSHWTVCSQTCGQGQQRRSRTCGGPDCLLWNNGEQRESRMCNQGYCPWGAWRSCSVTCGDGTRSRYRDCPGGGCKADLWKPLLTNKDVEVCRQKACITRQRYTTSPPVTLAPAPTVSKWENWGSWSECSSTCGLGQQARYRRCQGGVSCIGERADERACHLDPCGTWQAWGSWSHCSQTCGGLGQKFRIRYCHNGVDCPGPGEQSAGCGTVAGCRLSDPPAVFGGAKTTYTFWSEWSMCSRSCGGGTQSRTRACVKGACEEDILDTRSCAQDPCSLWSSWGTWSECTQSCGGGLRSKMRMCFQGRCPGESSEKTSCNTEDCSSVTSPPPTKEVEVSWSSWTHWTSCSVTCGLGSERRDRHCLHGSDCPGTWEEQRSCAESPCAEWGGWGHWSACSRSCGGGERRRIRNCYGQGECIGGLPTDSDSCATQLCSDLRRS